MNQETYIINSPNHPVKKDFDVFSVWCQWEDAEEVPFIKSLCESEKEFEERIISEYQKGKETYYPIPHSLSLPDHYYLMIKATIKINSKHIIDGYLSTSGSEVVSITLWPKFSEPDYEVHLYKYDLIVAEEENTKGLAILSKMFGITELTWVQYTTPYRSRSGQKIEGRFRCV